MRLKDKIAIVTGGSGGIGYDNGGIMHVIMQRKS